MFILFSCFMFHVTYLKEKHFNIILIIIMWSYKYRALYICINIFYIFFDNYDGFYVGLTEYINNTSTIAIQMGTFLSLYFNKSPYAQWKILHWTVDQAYKQYQNIFIWNAQTSKTCNQKLYKKKIEPYMVVITFITYLT